MTTSSYLKYLPAVLSSPPAAPGFSLGSMLCVFEKILTGIDDGVVTTHGDNSVMTTVPQAVAGSPLPQTIRVTAGTGTKFLAGSSYTYNGATPEVLNVTAAAANTITAVIRHNHAAGQTIVNSSGPHNDIQDVIAGLVNLYGAWTAPPDYLDWLAQWVALQFSPEWDEYQRRSVLSKIVGIYTERGTKQGLDTFFDIYAVASQPTRVVVDNKSKILFCKPQAGTIAPIPALVSQRPLVAPQCAAFDQNGFLLVCDLGSGDGIIPPSLWRISSAGEYDYSAGSQPLPPMTPQPPRPQPFQPSTLTLHGPVALAVDGIYPGAYIVDFDVDYVLYRLTSPQTGAVTLTGVPDPAQTATISIDGTTYPPLPETGGPSLDTQAAAWAVALNLSSPFSSAYVANAVGPSIVISPISGVPTNDLTLATTTSNSLVLSASGPCFGSSTVFANDTSVPPLGLKFPIAMAVNGTGNPLILDRGAVPGSPSATAVIEVKIALVGGVPTYAGTLPNPFGTIVEPLSMLLRADGSLVVGDGGKQSATGPADLVAINTATWTQSSLLGAMPPGSNPLISPTGIVEVDAQHLMVLDAGLRPYVQSGFTAVVAQQAAIYSVDLSVAPPVIAQISQFKALVYPRAMVGDGEGTLYICDSGLPDYPGYNSIEARSTPQQFAVVAHFQGAAGEAFFSLTLAGVPSTGQQCTLTIGVNAYTLPETTGYTVAVQAEAWVAQLNNNPSFNSLFMALAVGADIYLYEIPNTVAGGLAVVLGSSAGVTLTQAVSLSPTPVGTVTLSGVPTGGENCSITIRVGLLAPAPYTLHESGGSSVAQQAAAWCVQLNATPTFSGSLAANNSQAVINIFATIAIPNAGITLSVTSSAHLSLTANLGSQDHDQFLQSIRDVVTDQVPAQALWSLQSQ